VAEAANHAIGRTEALARLEERAGALSDNLVEGFQRLARRGELSHQELLQVMNAVQRENAELFMQVIRAMPDRAFGPRVGARGTKFFTNLAQRPRSMRFLVDANYDTFSALYHSSRYDFARFEENLVALKDIADGFPADQRAIEYRRLLDRLLADDPAALKQLRNAINTRRAAAGVPLIRSYSTAELDEIVRTTPDIREIERLGSQMDSGSAGRLFECWANRHVFGQQVNARHIQQIVRNADNPHLERLENYRRLDVYYQPDGTLWETKLYQSGTKIDEYQLDEYRKMEEAGHVITANGERLQVNGIKYLFSNRAAAEENLSTLHVKGAAASYIDDHGILQDLD
jgi:hypothetical protein